MPPSPLAPLETLYDDAAWGGAALALPPAVAALYGPLSFPPHPDRPYVLGNFISTLDGVVALGGGGDDGAAINDNLAQDRVVMGLLRACADVVVIGAATLRAIPRYLLTPEAIYRPLADEYRALRAALGKPPVPLHVVLSGSGSVDLSARMLASGEVPALIVTTPQGYERIRAAGSLPPSLTVARTVAHTHGGPGADPAETGTIHPSTVLASIAETLGLPAPLILVEGGPRVLSSFLAARLLDELFLTLSPLIAGRLADAERPGFTMGELFAPDNPRRAGLLSVKRSGSALFLRYALAHAPTSQATPPTDAHGVDSAR